MKSLTINPPTVFSRSLFFSFLLHFLVLGLFTFTFSVAGKQWQPAFSFLGSILQEQELQLGQKSAAAQTFISTGSFHWAAPASQTATPINKPVTKPFYFPVSEEGQKTHLKSTFAAQKSSMGKGAENTQIPGVNTAPPTYQPLRLYPDDKN